MGNPWMSKNPFMSMWLSTANRVAGSLRGQAAAQAKRQVTAVITEAASAPAPKARARPKPKPKTTARIKPKR